MLIKLRSKYLVTVLLTTNSTSITITKQLHRTVNLSATGAAACALLRHDHGQDRHTEPRRATAVRRSPTLIKHFTQENTAALPWGSRRHLYRIESLRNTLHEIKRAKINRLTINRINFTRHRKD